MGKNDNYTGNEYNIHFKRIYTCMVAENCHAKNAVFAGIIFVIVIYFLF